MTKKRYVPLRLRVVRNLFILTAMVAVTVGVIRFPAWKQDHYIRASVRAHGLTGETPVLWKGDVCIGGSKLKIRLYAEDDQIYASWIEFYEGSDYTLTLWDGDGVVIAETGGTLESIWEI